MKKKYLWVIVALFSFLLMGLNVNAESAPKTITTGSLSSLPEYIGGLDEYMKGLHDGSAYIYCEVANKKFPSNTTMYYKGVVDKGFVYIIKNKPTTGDDSYNYYVVQTAVWWYSDIVSGTNTNLSSTFKSTMANNRNSVSIYNAIYNLVEGARNYSESKGTISLVNNNKFTLTNGNYVSDPITVSASAVPSYNYELVNAPTGAKIINSTTKSFQVSVPASSVSEGSTVKFSVKVSGNYYLNDVYDYYLDTPYQYVILGKIFTNAYGVSTSTDFSIYKPVSDYNELRINKVDSDDKNVSGASLSLYEGNCVNETCAKADLYASWVSTTATKVFANIAAGTYTLVENSAPAGYRLASKMLIKVKSAKGTYTYSMVDEKNINVRISKTDITGQKEIPGATLVIKNTSNKVVDSWVSTDKPHYVTLEDGLYSLNETIAPDGYKLSTTTIVFKIADGKIYEQNSDGKYTEVSYIKMVNSLKDVVNISKLDSKTSGFVAGAILKLKNIKGDTITSWTTTTEAHYLSLDAGEYILTEESAPDGYELNSTPIYFKVDADGTLMVKNTDGNYVKATNVVMYDNKEENQVVIVPKTGLSSTLTYLVGFAVLASGAFVLIKNGKKC